MKTQGQKPERYSQDELAYLTQEPIEKPGSQPHRLLGAVRESRGGHGAHTQDGAGLSVTRPAALARFRVRAPRWWRRRAAGWHSVRLPDPSLWWRRDQTPEDCGCSGRSLTGEARVVCVHWGRRGDRRQDPRPPPAALRQVTGRRVPVRAARARGGAGSGVGGGRAPGSRVRAWGRAWRGAAAG